MELRDLQSEDVLESQAGFVGCVESGQQEICPLSVEQWHRPGEGCKYSSAI